MTVRIVKRDGDDSTSVENLFRQASDFTVDIDAIRNSLTRLRSDRNAHTNGVGGVGGVGRSDGERTRRDDGDPGPNATEAGTANDIGIDHSEPNPARIVADADVLAADLLVGGPSRELLDLVRGHSWITVIASDQLFDDAARVIGSVTNERLARDWRATADRWRERTAHPDGDHPALGSAYRGGAMHVITLDPALTGPRAAVGLRSRFPVSVRHPHAFVSVFSPERVYAEVVGGTYPGPDRDPRA